ncbi:MAG: hypothetical protein JW937_08535 [Candidatus Omnitrophica bacterium]|nr:hypothetical protein [Candidatus Omnitrophota bacterium]
MKDVQERKFNGMWLEVFIFVGLLCLGGLGVAQVLKLPSEGHASPSPGAAMIPAPDLSSVPHTLVDNFDKGKTSGVFTERENSLGAFQGTFAKRPSYTLITKSQEHRVGATGQGLIIDFQTKGGWCGWYTLLNGIDVSEYNALTFWIKGAEGAEKFDVGFADKQMQDLEIDAVYAGLVSPFLPAGRVTTEWQQAKIPISRISAQINLEEMGSLVFWFRYEGTGRVYVDDVMFAKDPGITKIEEENRPRAKKVEGHPRSLWVWKIDPVNNLRARADMWQLCEEAAIEILYLYFGEFDKDENPEYTRKLEEFLEQAHERHIEVEALAGNPVWCLPEYHDTCIGWIRSFLEYNAERPESRWIKGVSMDVEPYLTSEWNTDREMIKREYIVLLGKMRELIDSYKQPGFRLGAAVPVFYDTVDDGEFGRTVFSYLDYMALMSYYDTPRLMIDRSKYFVDLATELGKKASLGVETQDLIAMNQGLRRNTYIEEGWIQMEKDMDKVIDHFKDQPGFEGIAMHCYYSYRLMQKDRDVPTEERPDIEAQQPTLAVRAPGPVTIDGNLDDWDLSQPLEIRAKNQVAFGAGAWLGPQDLSYTGYHMWDEDALYVAYEFKDEKVVQEKTGADMWEGDHMELWVDVELQADYEEAVNSADDFQFGLSPGNFGTLPPEIHVWTPDLNPEQLAQVTDMQIGASKTGDGYLLEVRLPVSVLYMALDEISGNTTPHKLKKGHYMGLMADGSDTDAADQPQKAVISNSDARQWGNPCRFKILRLE